MVLASWTAAQRETFLKTHALPHFTKQSITDGLQFLQAVEEAARLGISVDREEYLEGVNAVAAPIRGANGTVVALLWIVGFASHFGGEAIEHASQQLRSEAETISRSLGAS